MKSTSHSQRHSPPATLSIGGATYDLFVRLPHALVESADTLSAIHLPLGEKIRVQSVVETNGGGACNTAVALSRLGCTARFAGVIGDDQWGKFLLQNFAAEGVVTDCLTVVEQEVTSFSIILSAGSGERVILYEPGTNAHLHDVTFNRDIARQMDWIILNHIHQHTCVIEDDVIAILQRPRPPGFTWNPGGCQIEAGYTATGNQLLLRHTTLLILNQEEAQRFTGKKQLPEMLRMLSTAGTRFVVITDGKRGSIATDGKHLLHCPIFDQPVVDTTGAGDAFTSGCTWALACGYDLTTALQAGTLNAASVVSVVGAQAGLLNTAAMQEKLTGNPLPVDIRPLPA